jgi:hypothetical protein
MAIAPVLAMTLSAAAAATVAKVVVNEWRRINAMLHPVPLKETENRKAMPTLKLDPRTGIYRPDARG